MFDFRMLDFHLYAVILCLMGLEHMWPEAGGLQIQEQLGCRVHT